MINYDLARERNLTPEAIARIDELHLDREKWLLELKKLMTVRELQAIDERLTEIEYQLQDAWGFERDRKFHKFWTRPKCRCPKLDNEERYGTGAYYITSSDCPLHGGY